MNRPIHAPLVFRFLIGVALALAAVAACTATLPKPEKPLSRIEAVDGGLLSANCDASACQRCCNGHPDDTIQCFAPPCIESSLTCRSCQAVCSCAGSH